MRYLIKSRFALNIVIDVVIQMVPKLVNLNSCFAQIVIAWPLFDLKVVPNGWNINVVEFFYA